MSNSNELGEHPTNAPASCPGVSSNEAGQASSCEGCPNQRFCASGGAAASRAQDDPSLPQLRARMASVKHKVLILSGKGGVGKSTVACTLAHMFAHLYPEKQIALLDVDLCGPTVPIMMGCLGEQVHQSASGWSPIFVEENLCVMSVAFLLSSHDDAVIWRGPRKNGLIKQFLRDVEWSHVDYLFIDCPPGTSDEHLSVVQYLRLAGGVDGAVLVTTPQELALADVRKEISFCLKVSLPILGIVENMSSFVCPHCGDNNPLFPATTGGADQLVKKFTKPDHSLRVIARLPLDPRITRMCDEGRSVLSLLEDGVKPIDYLQELERLAREVTYLCEGDASDINLGGGDLHADAAVST